MSHTLHAQPLTRENFAAYGDVIETSRAEAAAMNAARFERFDDLAKVDVDGRVAISIARCRVPSTLPLRVELVERHPLGSQAFVPLSPAPMVIVVAPAGAAVDVADLAAFVSNGRQGFNYRRGTWHMPLIAFSRGQEYLVIDRAGSDMNCEVHTLDEDVFLHADID